MKMLLLRHLSDSLNNTIINATQYDYGYSYSYSYTCTGACIISVTVIGGILFLAFLAFIIKIFWCDR
jgi:hypothetical protein